MKQSRSTIDKSERAKMAVRAILASYPMGASMKTDFTLLMIRSLETYPLGVIERVADMRSGITVRYPDYVPSHGQLIQFCDEVEDRLKQLQKPTSAQRIAATPKEEPGPALKTLEERKAFVAAELGYDVGPKGSKAPSTWCFPYKAPTIDISDFPDAPQSSRT
jgi:hypothetical protein